MLLNRYGLVNYDNEKKCDVIFCVSMFDNITDANHVAQAIKSKAAYAIDLSEYVVSEGAVIRDGVIYNVDRETGKETKAQRIPNESEQIKALKDQNEQILLALASIAGGATL